MKILSGIDITTRFKNYGNWAAYAYLQGILQALDFPDVDGVQIVDFVEKNISTDGNGHATISVTLLEQEIEIISEGFDSVYLRNNEGVLEGSIDHTNWINLLSSGSGDMTKAVYDANDDGNVDGAENLKSGNETISYADVAYIKGVIAARFEDGDVLDSFRTEINRSLLFQLSENTPQVSIDGGENWLTLVTS